jgi:hypothetical protein
MPEIEPVDFESADGEAKELLGQVQALLGATIGISLAPSPGWMTRRSRARRFESGQTRAVNGLHAGLVAA